MYAIIYIYIAILSFKWNLHKNAFNQKKHGLSFAETKEIFSDESAILFDAPEHSMIRRVDNLGRVVIPQSIREELHFQEGNLLEFTF